MAYYNMTTGAILDLCNDGLKIGGSIHLNKFALAKKHHGSYYQDGEEKIKLSDFIFYSCLANAIKLREYVGFSFITLCSTNEGFSLYRRAGFEPVDDDMSVAHDSTEKGCHEMYLALDLEN